MEVKVEISELQDNGQVSTCYVDLWVDGHSAGRTIVMENDPETAMRTAWRVLSSIAMRYGAAVMKSDSHPTQMKSMVSGKAETYLLTERFGLKVFDWQEVGNVDQGV